MPKKVTQLNLLEGPRVCNPINGVGGLYMKLLKERDTPMSDLYPLLKAQARAHGFDPEGSTRRGMPSQHGLTTHTVAVWFHDRIKRA